MLQNLDESNSAKTRTRNKGTARKDNICLSESGKTNEATSQNSEVKISLNALPNLHISKEVFEFCTG